MSKEIKSIKMYSTTWCSDCFRTRAFFEENGVNYEEIDIEKHPEHVALVEKINNGNRSVPTIIVTYDDESQDTLVEPSNDKLEEVFVNQD